MRSELSLLWHLFATSQRVKGLLQTAMAESPLSPEEYAVYSLLAEAGPMGPTELARRLGIPPTTMSHHVRGLVERRHGTRERDGADGRSHLLHLTRAGREVHRAAGALFEDANQRFRRALAQDEEQVTRALIDIGRAADEAALMLDDNEATG